MTARASARGRRRGTGVEAFRAAVGVGHAVRAGRGGGQPVLDAVLAVRQVVQAALVARAGTTDAHTISAVVDTVHGLTMVPLAVVGRKRRFALGQLGIALVLVVAECAAVGTGRRTDRGGR